MSTAAVNRKKTQGFSEGKKSEASRRNSSEIHKLSGPHMMKRQKMFARTAPFWGFQKYGWGGQDGGPGSVLSECPQETTIASPHTPERREQTQ